MKNKKKGQVGTGDSSSSSSPPPQVPSSSTSSALSENNPPQTTTSGKMIRKSDHYRIGSGHTKMKTVTIQDECWTLLKEFIINCEHEDELNIFEYLTNCMITSNPRLEQIMENFAILKHLCEAIASEPCENYCLKELIFNIIEIAEKLPILFPEQMEMLRQNETKSVVISKLQACCILANAFLCTFANRLGNPKMKNYPRINFNELYVDDTQNYGRSWQGQTQPTKLEKLKCIMNYFSRSFQRQAALMDEDGPDETDVIIYERKVLQEGDDVDWEHSQQPFRKMQAFCEGAIEDAEERLQVDFANKFVGGGTLGNGAAQEEIRFVTCPELIAAQYFTECLCDHEALVVSGFEQFSAYSGYGSSFQFGGDYEQEPSLRNQMVMLDAYRFPRNSQVMQYADEHVTRELYKCLAGFKSKQETDMIPLSTTVASGKWGCGIFQGEAELKCVLQWMATSVADKDLELYTFGDNDLTHKLNELSKLVHDHDINVGFMYSLIKKFGESLRLSRKPFARSLIKFLKSEIVPDTTTKVGRQKKHMRASTAEETGQLVPHSDQNSYRSRSYRYFCMLLQIPIVITNSVLFIMYKIPLLNWVVPKLGSYVQHGSIYIFGFLAKCYKKLLKIKTSHTNIQAASRVRDIEKEQLDLSDDSEDE